MHAPIEVAPRRICPGCERPAVVCLCAHFDAIDTRTRVVFLQHPREHEVPINSARLAHRSLRHSSLHVGVDFSTDRAVTRALSDPAAPAIVLFPSPNARDVRREPPRGPVTLVVLDGTWSQAEKLLRANPMLSTLPHYAFVPTTASNYRIRRQPAEHCVATIEAIAEVLALLEDRPVDGARLLAPFHAMVEYQLAYAARFAGTRSRHVHARRAPRERPIPPLLAEPSPRALVVYGEANAWPHHAQGTPPPSIVHWVAERLATGERFEALIRPDDAVAPATPYHTGLAAEAIACGEEHEAFLSRWSRFAREDDVWVAWGDYATDVFARRWPGPRERLDLHRATALFTGTRTGALEEVPARLGFETIPVWAAGRAGRRVAAVTAIARGLGRRAAERAAAG